MLTIAVCDDSLLDLSQVEEIMNSLKYLNIDFDVFSNASDLLSTIQREGKYDLYLLDIELDDTTGFEVAAEIRKHDCNALLVFLTAHSKYVLESFDYITFQYIIKPITKSKLESLFIKANNYLYKSNRLFRYRFKKGWYSVACNEIYYFYKVKRRAYIYTKNGIAECNMTINDILSQLPSDYFVQINRSYIINLQHVETVHKEKVIIIGERLSVSATHSEKLITRYMNYVGKIM